MSVRSVSAPRAVFQSATPADRTSRRSSSDSVVRARACVRAHGKAWRKALRVRACWHAGALPKLFPVARGDNARMLVTGPLGRLR